MNILRTLFSKPICLKNIVYVFIASMGVGCHAEDSINQQMDKFFSKSESSTTLDLKSFTPDTWERICIGFLPYAAQSDVESRLQGKVTKNYEVVGDSNWVLFGITAKGEIIQVVLSIPNSKFLSNHFHSSPEKFSCVSRNRAVFSLQSTNNKTHVEFGKN